MLHQRSAASTRFATPAPRDRREPPDDDVLGSVLADAATTSLDFDDVTASRLLRDGETTFDVEGSDVAGPFDGAWSPRDAADIADGLDGDAYGLPDFDPYD